MATKIEKMVKKAKDICADSSVGYSQNRRWLNPDVDCSSMMYICANAGGFNIKTGSGYTGTMLSDFKNAGFTAVRFDGVLTDLEPGDIMLNVQNHTEMCVGDGKFAGAHIDENGGIAGNKGGDQTGNEVSIVNAYIYSSGWDYVLCPPRTDKDTVGAPTATTDLDKVARDVIAGKYGNGDERTKNLKMAGYSPTDVQLRVNNILNKPTPKTDIDKLARDVIAGKYGNGDERKDRLGEHYAAVQKRVNELL